MNDKSSATGYRQHQASAEAVAQAVDSAAAVLRQENKDLACAGIDESVSAFVRTADFEWQYVSSMTDEGGCRPDLRQVGDQAWSDLSEPAGQQAEEYAERFVLYLDRLTNEESAASDDAQPWPLQTPLSALWVNWDDEHKLSGCAEVYGDEVRLRDLIRDSSAFNRVVVQTNEEPAGQVRVGLELLLPGEETGCARPTGAAGHLDDTLDSLGPEDVVIDVQTFILLPTPGSMGTTVIVRADGQAVVDDDTSATGYVVRQISSSLVRTLAGEAAETFYRPKSTACRVADGAAVTYRGRTDLGSWMGFVDNPSLCGWPGLPRTIESLREAIIESGAVATPYVL